MKYKIHFLLATIMLSLIIACSCPETNKNDEPVRSHLSDTSENLVLADTIIYDVIIRNTDASDVWTTECLRNLDRNILVDSLFNLVYNKKALAFDFFENTSLSLNEIKKLETESDYSRDKIGKLQFTEAWYINNSTHSLEKEVLAVVLGYELYDDNGNVRGYRPIFKIYF